MQKAKQRSEIAQQDKWRIEDIYATDEAWEADYNECIRRASRPRPADRCLRLPHRN